MATTATRSPDGAARLGSLAEPAPTHPGSRRYGRAAAGALLFAVAVVGAFQVAGGDRRPVLVVAHAVAAGERIKASDLGEAKLSADPALRPVPAARKGEVAGRVAAVGLLPGTLLTSAALAEGPLVGPGRAVAGIGLKSAQLPYAGLRAGDRVAVLRTVPAGASAGGSAEGAPPGAPALVADARVFAVAPADASGTTLVSLDLAADEVAPVATAAAAGQVSLVLLGG